MRHRLLLPLAFAVAASAACTTQTTTITDPPAAAPDAGPSEEVEPPVVDAGTADSASEPEEAPLESVVVRDDVGQSCDDVCGRRKYTCDAVCEFGNNRGKKLAGQATYSYTENSFTSYEYEPIAACADVAPKTLNRLGRTFRPDISFGSPLSCCCQAPGHFRVKGDPTAPKSCAEICTAAGHKCDPNTPFRDLFGAGDASYRCSDSTLLASVAACTEVPAKTKASGRETCSLSEFTCGCL